MCPRSPSRLARQEVRRSGAPAKDADPSEFGVVLVPALVRILRRLFREVPVGKRTARERKLRVADLYGLLAAFGEAGRSLPVVPEPWPELRAIEPGGGITVTGMVRTVLDGALCSVVVWDGAEGLGRYVMLRMVRTGEGVRARDLSE